MPKKASPYVVGLREIPPEGLHLTFDLSGDFARAAFADTEVKDRADTARVSATVDLAKAGDEIVAHGALTGHLSMLCSRCAGPAAVKLDSGFDVLYLPRDADPPEGADGAEAPDIIPYENEEIDLGDVLREEVLLALPYAPLCSESCPGLCPNCGNDLNAGPCNCADTPADGRFAVLRNLKVPEV